jgi:Mn2+/Fe2+ NRAMP family transporter
MLADTDAGSIVTAAQSGAVWRFAMVVPLVVLIPVLFAIQEITVRLGVVTGKGHGALIKEHFGTHWAALSVCTLFVACIGALVTEFAGIAGVGSMFGIPPLITVSGAATTLVVLVLTESYSRVERIGIAVGLFEFLFVAALFVLPVHPSAVAARIGTIPVTHSDFRFLLAANVGAVIMPWMIFFQQGAVIDKRLRSHQLSVGRWDTLAGSIVTQVIMISIVVATASTVGRSHPGTSLPTIGAVATALSPFMGSNGARLVFGLGLAGAALVAALVVSLAAAWGISEVVKWRHSVNDSPAPALEAFTRCTPPASLSAALR